jgi:hypothetical protein
LAITTGARQHKEAVELVVVASGQSDPLWRGDLEACKESRAAELTAELEEVCERHADERGGSVRFFARWLDASGNVLLGTSWRQGSGGQIAMDGSAESVAQQMQSTVLEVLKRDGERQDAMMALLENVMGSLHAENKMLRDELRVAAMRPEPDGVTRDDAQPRIVKQGSNLDRTVSELAEYAGRKWIDKAMSADASAGADGDVKKADS